MQAVRRRLLSAGTVLAVGSLSALPFYHYSPPADSTKSSLAADPNSTNHSGAVALQIPGGEDAPNPTLGTEVNSAVVSEAAHHAESGKSSGSEQRPLPAPQLTQRRPSAEETVPPAAPIRRAAGDPVSATTREPQPPSKNSVQRTHWITDGDTLEELARRFLGDPSRWREIREANPDILTTDDILPIGKQIRIPPREVRNSPASNSPTAESTGLVPIPWKAE